MNFFHGLCLLMSIGTWMATRSSPITITVLIMTWTFSLMFYLGNGLLCLLPYHQTPHLQQKRNLSLKLLQMALHLLRKNKFFFHLLLQLMHWKWYYWIFLIFEYIRFIMSANTSDMKKTTPVLVGTSNYLEWKSSMKSLLQVMGVWHYANTQVAAVITAPGGPTAE